MAVLVATLVAWVSISAIVFTLLPCPSQSIHLKMVHKFSRHSPSFPGDLTDKEMTRLLLEHDRLRAQGNSYRPTTPLEVDDGGRSSTIMRPKLGLSPAQANYLVEIGIGTPPTQHLLRFDTTGETAWLQCLPCWQCFTNPRPIYSPNNSKSYFVESCLPDEQTCYEGVSMGKLNYEGGGSSEGLKYYETLWFPSSDGKKLLPIENVPFLCGKNQTGFGSAPGFEGVASFGYAPYGWPMKISGGKFSYCFRNESAMKAQPAGVLRLGDEAVLSGPEVKRVPLFLRTDGSTLYYLNLTDVSVAGRSVGVKPGTFVDSDGKPGFFMDSSSSFTNFATGGAYERVAAAFEAYFGRFGLKRLHKEQLLCYRNRAGFSSFPNMTFHFDNGVEFVVPNRNVVKSFPGHFCILLTKGDNNRWGAVQQRDYRISYDILGKELAFVPADCDLVL